jgi:uncharacterized protein YaeQ
MALKATVFKANLNVADLDRQVYGDFPLTIARHPSETDSRMMLRLLVFALHADEQLSFGRGISTDDEPDLWRKSLSGEIEQWIDLGTPQPERLRKARGRASAVVLYAYGDRAVPMWWRRHGAALERLDKLRIAMIPDATCEALAGLCEPVMALQCTIDGGEAWISTGAAQVHVIPEWLKRE